MRKKGCFCKKAIFFKAWMGVTACFPKSNLAIFALYMRLASTVLKAIFTIYGFILFISFMLVIFPFVIIASFFGKLRGGNAIYMLCKAWARFFLFFTGIRVIHIYEGLKPEPGKQYVCVFNHISYLDIPLLMLALPQNRFRVLGKAELTKVPLFGFLYRNAVVLVERSNSGARAKSVMQLKSILRKGISVVIAPEGTFNITHKPLKEFYDGAFKVAIETQTPVKPILFLDAYDRLPYKPILSLNPGKARIVYLDEVPVDGYSLKDAPVLKDKVYKMMEEKLLAYKASWINNE